MVNENKSGKNAPEHSTNGTTPDIPNQFDRMVTNEEHNQDLKERLQKEHGAKLINYEELIVIAPKFALWLKEIIRYRNVDSNVLIFWDINRNDGANHFSCIIFTNDNKHTFYGYEPTKDKPNGYLGAGATGRKPRPGETWNGGNDLPDGSYTKETFDSIVKAIVAYEIKTLQLWRK
ncbi:MAG: hypothetical protein PF487_09785 [Bacteroidales bacterium]|jgi:hypothetical protein|nr:hypothetical protein [Bacteroidales bacterium]